MLENDLLTLQNQVNIARNEINKLRQQVRNLQHIQRKDIEGVARLLRDFRCDGCRLTAEENTRNSNESPQLAKNDGSTLLQDGNALEPCSGVRLQPIGIIRTAFPEKRAVPRQSSVGGRLRGMIELNFEAFTNPEHALQGLDEYSHMWLVYHFHKNNAHPKAKVAPPRLGGERVGVFSTRSPHRPCPLGLSLVEIEKVDGATVTFYGTDMVDGTPLLDIKPYIPFYDAPAMPADTGRISVGPLDATDFYDSRQEPDGEESELEMLAAGAIGGGGNGMTASANGSMHNPPNIVDNISPPASAVKVPNWVMGSKRLKVYFNERAEQQLQELHSHRQCIVDILEADPRSVYLRTKYGSQIFTFQLSEVTVTCKFDDKAGTVTVVQIRRTENVQDEEVHD